MVISEKVSRGVGLTTISIDLLVVVRVRHVFTFNKSCCINLNLLLRSRSRIIYTGYKRDLVQEDLWELEKTELSGYLTKKFESNWIKKANSYIKRKREATVEEEVKNKAKKAAYKSTDGQNEEQVNLKDDVSGELQEKKLNTEKIWLKIRSNHRKRPRSK